MGGLGIVGGFLSSGDLGQGVSSRVLCRLQLSRCVVMGYMVQDVGKSVQISHAYRECMLTFLSSGNLRTQGSHKVFKLSLGERLLTQIGQHQHRISDNQSEYVRVASSRDEDEANQDCVFREGGLTKGRSRS